METALEILIQENFRKEKKIFLLSSPVPGFRQKADCLLIAEATGSG